MRKQIIAILIIVFLLLAGLFGYLLIRNNKLGDDRQVVEPTSDPLILNKNPAIKKRNIPSDEGNYIEGSYYELEGILTEELQYTEGDVNGRFVLKDDENGRSFKFVLPQSANYEVYLGTYEGSFASGSSWRWVPREVALSVVEVGDPIKLNTRVFYKGIQSDKEARERQEILDAYLLDVMGGGGEEISIPSDFYFFAEGIGIIR